MTEAGERLIEAAKEALAIARGDTPARRIHIDGHTYVHIEELDAALLASHPGGTAVLAAKAKKLVEMLDEREKYHGSLIGQETLMLVNDLRLELARWVK